MRPADVFARLNLPIAATASLRPPEWTDMRGVRLPNGMFVMLHEGTLHICDERSPPRSMRGAAARIFIAFPDYGHDYERAERA